MTDRERRPLSRRDTLRGTAVAGLSAPVLAACGAEGGGSTAPSTEAPSGAPPGAFTTTGEIPEGSGMIFSEQELVVTQPEPGTFKGFSSTCTHQGCTVNEVADTINCPCHGSTFSITDGSVVDGPAPSPLPEIGLAVDGEQISRS